MSREIKFRAWLKSRWEDDEDAEKMYYDVQNSYDNLGNVEPYDPMTSFEGWLIDDVADVEQYTGLKDRHSTEIYEGDVVLDYYDGEDAFIVEWDKDTASFILVGTDHIASVSFDNFDADIDLEVIGNIHENPELLEN